MSGSTHDRCRQGPSNAPTLAASLVRLVPGDACPCCGAPLRIPSARTRIDRLTGAAGPAAATGVGVSLECPVCGCEVEPVDDVPATRGGWERCVAA